MSKDSHPHSGDGADTMERCPHDRENPYAQISRALIRDKSISPLCRMVLIFLLSNDEKKWVIRTDQICHSFEGYLGRDKTRKIINEAIEAGYIRREEYLLGNLKRSKYYLSEEPKFKKCCPRPEIKGPGEKGLLERTYEEKTYKKKIIIAQPTVESHLPEKTPAAGNNNFSAKKEEKKIYPCLEELDIPETTKKSITAKHTEQDVQHVAQLLTHKDSPYKDKPKAEAAKIIQHALKDQGSYKDTIDNLGQPKLTKQQREAKQREIALSEDEQRIEQNYKWVKQSGFINFATYKGWKCKITEDSIGFSAKRSGWTVHYRQKDFMQSLQEHLKSFGIDIPIV